MTWVICQEKIEKICNFFENLSQNQHKSSTHQHKITNPEEKQYASRHILIKYHYDLGHIWKNEEKIQKKTGFLRAGQFIVLFLLSY